MASKKSLKQLERIKIKEHFKQWSIDVRNRDKKCVICSSTKFLNAHHIIPRENKDLRFDLNNGITLCVKHHKFSLEISPHRNSFMFYLWLQSYNPKQFYYLKNQIMPYFDNTKNGKKINNRLSS